MQGALQVSSYRIDEEVQSHSKGSGLCSVYVAMAMSASIESCIPCRTPSSCTVWDTPSSCTVWDTLQHGIPLC